jgi:putative endonuclease
MYYLYILRCADDTLYTGITTDIERRIAEHNEGTGAKYTRGKGPVEMIYSKKYRDRSKASVAEAKVKALSRAEKLALVTKS